jgi:replicative DNA helicase
MGKPAKKLTSGIPDLALDSGLPANVDAERTILGSILLDNDAFFDECCDDIRYEDFSLDSHRRIFNCMTEIMYGLVEGAHNVDIVTLANELARLKEIESVGGVAYLASLTEGLPRRPVIGEYVRIIKDKSRLRKIMLICSAAIARAADQGDVALKVLEELEAQLVEVTADQKMDAVKASEIVGTIEANLLAKRNQNLDKTALDMTWGIEALDEKTKGIFGGELTILAGDTAGGKTQAMMQMVLANALEGTPVGIFSLEMPKEKLIQRLYSLMSDILTADHMRDPRLMNIHTHVPEMSRVSAAIAKLPIYVDDTSPLTIQKLRARIKMMKRRRGIRIAAVDYVQLLGCPGKTGVDKTEEILYGLRDTAKHDPDTAVVALSQFSKEQGFVKRKRRTKGDLFGGSILQHAAQNIIIITMEDSEKRAAGDDLDVEIMVDKCREGVRGRVTCVYDRKKLKFVSSIQKPMDYSTVGKNKSAGE